MSTKEISAPKIITLPTKLISISRGKITAEVGNKYVVILEKAKSRISFSIWVRDDNNGIENHGIGNIGTIGDIDSLELHDEFKRLIKSLVENWDVILQKRIAETILRKGVSGIPKINDREILADEIAEKILSKNVIKTFYTISNDKEVEIGIFCYDKNKGVYKSCEREIEKGIENFVMDTPELRVKTTKWVVDEAISKIKRRTYEIYHYEHRKLVFNNKIFDWDTFISTGDLKSSLENPTSDTVIFHWIPNRINIEKLMSIRQGIEKYIPPTSVDQLIEVFKALAPKSYRAFLSWVRYPGEDESEAKNRIALLLEIIGYTLYPHEYPFNKAILLTGEGSNGKSTFCNLLTMRILGEHNVSSLSIRNLDPRINRFAIAELVNKLANISSETPKGQFDPTLFKQITGQDPVMVERKYKDPYTTTIYAKMIFTANQLPRVTEDTYAFWRRWIVLEFPNRFKDDPEFFEKTFTPEEVEGIIIVALYAFRLVMLRKGFTEQGGKDPRNEWISRSEPVYRVIRAMIDDGIVELNPYGYVVKKDLYSLYTAYTEKLRDEGENVETVSQSVFTQKLEQLFGVRGRQRRILGINKRVYVGIRIRDYEAAGNLVDKLETPWNTTYQAVVSGNE